MSYVKFASLILGTFMLVGTLKASASEIKPSELKMRSCITSVYSSASNLKGASKDTIKFVSTGVKDCRAAVKSIAKKESETKKRMKLEAQIAKLQLKLKG